MPGPRWRCNDDSYAERDPPRWSEARERLSVQKSRQEFTPRASDRELLVNIYSFAEYFTITYFTTAYSDIRDKLWYRMFQTYKKVEPFCVNIY